MKTINDRWKEFEEKVIPKNACRKQRIESKRMFFCGFACCLDVMTTDLGGANLSEEQILAAIGSLNKQLLGFNEAIQLGEA